MIFGLCSKNVRLEIFKLQINEYPRGFKTRDSSTSVVSDSYEYTTYINTSIKQTVIINNIKSPS